MRCGALVEPTIRTYSIDTELIEWFITEKTKAILTVHLYGHIAYSEAMRKIADKYGLKIIEDCAQAQGGDYRGKVRELAASAMRRVLVLILQKTWELLEMLVQSLGLPYRILRLCGGDMSFASALTYDFEVYSAAQERWLEVSSVSNFETFQTNRMKIRYKDGSGKTQLVHSLNGSSLALPRIMACLLENNQTPDGIRLPEVLWKYFGGQVIG